MFQFKLHCIKNLDAYIVATYISTIVYNNSIVCLKHWKFEKTAIGVHYVVISYGIIIYKEPQYLTP